MEFMPNQLVYCIFLGETCYQSLFVFPNSFG